jgi:hypothetical protein
MAAGSMATAKARQLHPTDMPPISAATTTAPGTGPREQVSFRLLTQSCWMHVADCLHGATAQYQMDVPFDPRRT